MCIFLILKSEVNSWAYSLFLATIITPEVSLSSLWTTKGFVCSKYFVFFNISMMFLKDFVPAWTGIPLGLLITIKLSLFSMINLPYSSFSFSDGLYFSFLDLLLGFKSPTPYNSTTSFNWTLYDVLTFFLFILIFFFLISFYIYDCWTLDMFCLIHLSKRESW